MSYVASGSLVRLAPRIWDPADRSVRQQVRDVLGTLYPKTVRLERRREERFPFPRLVHLRPTAEDGVTLIGACLTAVGKDLSEKGLGFFHAGPFPHRLAVASLERADDVWLSFLLDITWMRFRTQGWYESGGRFLRTVPFSPEMLD